MLSLNNNNGKYAWIVLYIWTESIQKQLKYIGDKLIS